MELAFHAFITSVETRQSLRAASALASVASLPILTSEFLISVLQGLPSLVLCHKQPAYQLG